MVLYNLERMRQSAEYTAEVRLASMAALMDRWILASDWLMLCQYCHLIGCHVSRAGMITWATWGTRTG